MRDAARRRSASGRSLALVLRVPLRLERLDLVVEDLRCVRFLALDRGRFEIEQRLLQLDDLDAEAVDELVLLLRVLDVVGLWRSLDLRVLRRLLLLEYDRPSCGE